MGRWIAILEGGPLDGENYTVEDPYLAVVGLGSMAENCRYEPSDDIPIRITDEQELRIDGYSVTIDSSHGNIDGARKFVYHESS